MLWCNPSVKEPRFASAYYVMNGNFMDKLSRWEIPAFYMYANKKELYNAEGEMIIFNKEENNRVYEKMEADNSAEKGKSDYRSMYKDGNFICSKTPHQSTYDHFKEEVDKLNAINNITNNTGESVNKLII